MLISPWAILLFCQMTRNGFLTALALTHRQTHKQTHTQTPSVNPSKSSQWQLINSAVWRAIFDVISSVTCLMSVSDVQLCMGRSRQNADIHWNETLRELSNLLTLTIQTGVLPRRETHQECRPMPFSKKKTRGRLIQFLYSVIQTEYVRMDPGCLSVCLCVSVCDGSTA